MVDAVVISLDAFRARKNASSPTASDGVRDTKRAEPVPVNPDATVPVNATVAYEQMDELISVIHLGLRTLRRLGVSKAHYEKQGDAFEDGVNAFEKACPRLSAADERNERRRIVMVTPEQANAKEELMDGLEAVGKAVFEATVVAAERQRVLRTVDRFADAFARTVVEMSVGTDAQPGSEVSSDAPQKAERIAQCLDSLTKARESIGTGDLDAARRLIADADRIVQSVRHVAA